MSSNKATTYTEKQQQQQQHREQQQQQQQQCPKQESDSSSSSDPMMDSGFCGSLRMDAAASSSASASLQGSVEASSEVGGRKEEGDDEEKCRELIGRISLAGGENDSPGKSPSDNQSEDSTDAWREYFDPDEDGDVQLHLAVASGFVDVVFALVRMAPHPDYLGIRNKAAYAPLHIAVLQDRPAVARRLVVAGAAMDVRDGEGNTPLHLAARRGNASCAEALLRPVEAREMRDAGLAQPALLTRLPTDVVDLRNHAGETCAHLAAMGGHADVLRLLCWNGADVNAPDGRGGRSVLHFAVGAGDAAAVRALAEPRPRGCGADVSQPDWYGRTPCQLALLNGNLALADFLARVMTADPSASAAALFPGEAAAAVAAAAAVPAGKGGSSDPDADKASALLLNSSA